MEKACGFSMSGRSIARDPVSKYRAKKETVQGKKKPLCLEESDI